jgi:hypothetical protein
VLWQVVDGPEEWIGTKVSWELKQDGDYVIVLFKHLDWKEPVEFMHHCSTKWAIFLMSLKSLVETGVIGAGNMGGTLARRLAKLGHQVSIANSRGPQSLTASAASAIRRTPRR